MALQHDAILVLSVHVDAVSVVGSNEDFYLVFSRSRSSTPARAKNQGMLPSK